MSSLLLRREKTAEFLHHATRNPLTGFDPAAFAIGGPSGEVLLVTCSSLASAINLAELMRLEFVGGIFMRAAAFVRVEIRDGARLHTLMPSSSRPVDVVNHATGLESAERAFEAAALQARANERSAATRLSATGPRRATLRVDCADQNEARINVLALAEALEPEGFTDAHFEHIEVSDGEVLHTIERNGGRS